MVTLPSIALFVYSNYANCRVFDPCDEWLFNVKKSDRNFSRARFLIQIRRLDWVRRFLCNRIIYAWKFCPVTEIFQSLLNFGCKENSRVARFRVFSWKFIFHHLRHLVTFSHFFDPNRYRTSILFIKIVIPTHEKLFKVSRSSAWAELRRKLFELLQISFRVHRNAFKWRWRNTSQTNDDSFFFFSVPFTFAWDHFLSADR